MERPQEINDLLKKAAKFKSSGPDLSSDEDLSIAVMNLISIEEHFFFTGAKTADEKYFDLLGQVREIRKALLAKIVKEPEGEVWCISKHLLASTMRLMEVGTKQLGLGKKNEAKEMLDKAYRLYSLFWGLNLKLIEVGQIKSIAENQLNIKDDKTDFWRKLGQVIKKLIDCCKE